MSSRIWSALNGYLCVYKPVNSSIAALKKQIVKRICSEGNECVEWPRLPTIQRPIVEPHSKSGALVVVGISEQPDYSVHPFVCGEAFRPEDIRIEELYQMEPSCSGVCLFGINDACDEIPELLARSWVSDYRIEAILGRETHRHEIGAKVTLRADYDHVTRHRVGKLLSKIEHNFRKAAFDYANVDRHSEEAYELARRGLPRAQIPGAQIIYKLELKSFKAPYFVVNVQASGETDAFLRCFIHEVGIGLGTTASTIRLQRRSIGPLVADDALLEKQITLQNIVRNIAINRRILDSTKHDDRVISKRSRDTEQDRKERDEVIDSLGRSQKDASYDAMRPAWPRNYEE